jgi:hypothetical protein
MPVASDMTGKTGRDAFIGSCLCGAVTFTGRGLRGIVFCHCSQCRHAHGTCAAYSATPTATFSIMQADKVSWFAASSRARRGFCRTCGSSLFWAPNEEDYICVAAGSIDQGPVMEPLRHVYVADRASYETLDGRLPASAGSMHARQG